MIILALRKTFIKLLVLFFTAILFCPQMSLASQLVDRIVAVVNDDVITSSELEEEGREYLDKVRETTPANSLDEALMAAKNRILDNLISQRLITQNAEAANIKLSDQEFDQAYARNRQAMNLSDEDFLKKLKRSGLTEENYKNNLRNQMLRDKLVLYEVRSKIIVTEEMMLEYYDTEYSKEVQGGGYYILQMGFSWGKSDTTPQSDEVFAADKAKALERAEKARQMVIDGADFGSVARNMSELPSAADGGDLGTFQEEEMASYMRDAILPLKAGDVSQIIETVSGYQFFKLLSSKEGEITHQVPYFEVKEEVRNKLFEQKFKEEFTRWVEGIKKEAYIKKMLN